MSTPSAVRRFLASLIAGFALAGPASADTVYVVSQSTNKLVRFESTDTAATTSVTTLLSNLSSPSGLTFGPDGRLYIAEWGDGETIDPRVSRYDIGTNQWSVVATLDPLAQFQPSAIAFRPTALGGEMLVGRTGTLDATGEGGIVKISGWNTGSPVVSQTPYNTGITLDGSSGLAVATNGTTYVSNSQYVTAGTFGIFTGTVVELNASGAYQRVVVPDGSQTNGLSGPAGLILNGSTLRTGSVTNSNVFQTNVSTLATTAFAGAGGGFNVGPIAGLADGSTLGGSLSGVARIYRFLPNGSLASSSYFNNDFGLVGGIAVAPVPEPGTWCLALTGLAGLGWVARRSRSRGRPA